MEAIQLSQQRPFECLLTGYAVGYNLKYQRHGHLFQNRYKSIVCEEEPYLLELVRYICQGARYMTPLGSILIDPFIEYIGTPLNNSIHKQSAEFREDS